MKCNFFIIILLFLLLYGTVYSKPRDVINKNNPPGGNLIEYIYSGISPETSFKILHPNGWIIANNNIGGFECVTFMPPWKKPVRGIIVMTKKSGDITSPEEYLKTFYPYKYSELVPNTLQEVKINEYFKCWKSDWVMKGKYIKELKDFEEVNQKNDYLICNCLYLKDGIAFSLTGWTIKSEKDKLIEFVELFRSIAIEFKPGLPPQNIALTQPTLQPSPTVSVNLQPSPTVNVALQPSPTVSVNLQPSPTVNVALQPSPTVNSNSSKNVDLNSNIIIINPPVKNLTIEYTGSKVNIKGLADNYNGVAQVFINNKEALLSELNEQNKEFAKEQNMVRPVEFTADLLLAPGENKFEVLVVDLNGKETKKSYTIKRLSDNIQTSSPGKQWAVIIGISQYQNPKINPLKYTVKDAKSMYDYLIKKAGFEESHIKLLLNQEATTVNIRKALGEFLAKNAVTKDDMVFIYFSGHGAPEPDLSGKESDGLSKYIITYDTDPESLYSTAFPMNEVATIFSRIEAQKIVFFIDSCYSGASGGKTFASVNNGKTVNISDTFLTSLSGNGRLIITASDANEISLEKDELGHGIFTYYLLEAIGGKGDLNNDGLITVDEAYQYLYENVAKSSEGRQHPVKRGESTGQIVIGIKK